jgi:hypothetical protein
MARQVLIRRTNAQTQVVDMVRANVLAETADTVRVKLPFVREPRVFNKKDVTATRTIQHGDQRCNIIEKPMHSANSFASKLY